MASERTRRTAARAGRTPISGSLIGRRRPTTGVRSTIEGAGRKRWCGRWARPVKEKKRYWNDTRKRALAEESSATRANRNRRRPMGVQGRRPSVPLAARDTDKKKEEEPDADNNTEQELGNRRDEETRYNSVTAQVVGQSAKGSSSSAAAAFPRRRE